jgi:hypothetical protein
LGPYRTLDVLDPSSGRVIDMVSAGDKADVDLAVIRANVVVGSESRYWEYQWIIAGQRPSAQFEECPKSVS